MKPRKTALRPGLEVRANGDRLLITDRFGIFAPTELDELGARALLHVLHGTTLTDNRRETTVTDKDLKGMKAELRAAGILEGPVSRRQLQEEFSRQVLDGSLVVPGRNTASELRSLADGALERARRSLASQERGFPRAGVLEAAVSPHGDLRSTGDCAAHSYALLSPETWPDLFVIIGTSHYSARTGILATNMHTPLGRIDNDPVFLQAVTRAIHKSFSFNDPCFLIEHSWRQDLPLLQFLASEFRVPLRVLPMFAGGLTQRSAIALGKRLRALAFGLRKRVCVIASGDLTHVGDGYPWRPPWSLTGLSQRDVITGVLAFERPILEQICQRDHEAFATSIKSTSFCARAHVHVAMAFASVPGEVLQHTCSVNWQRTDQPLAGPWRPSDKAFFAASIAYFVPIAPTTGRAAGLRLCPQVMLDTADQIQAFHPCDNSAYAFPKAAADVLQALRRGVRDVEHLRSQLTTVSASTSVLLEFVEGLEDAGLLHAAERPTHKPSRFLLSRAMHAIEKARVHVPYYRDTLVSNSLQDAPMIDSNAIVEKWNRFLHDDAGAIPPEQLYLRSSSGSTGGARLVTAERADVRREHQTASRLMHGPEGKMFSLNRPDNLSIAVGDQAKWPLVAESGAGASPGPNPSEVSNDVLDRLIQLAVTYEPEILEGDPAYLSAFARRCISLGVSFAKLRAVRLGHSYAWRPYVDVIERAFGVPTVRMFHSSEVGSMATTCPLGDYHLLEAHVLYEVVRHGQWAKLGQLGALVLTTLDADLRPLIRYSIGDVVRLVAAKCPCGLPGRTIRYEGRIKHLLRGPSGRIVTYVDIDQAIGAPPGLAFFRITARPRDATLTLVPVGERAIVPADDLAAKLAALLGRPIEVRWAAALPLASPIGKLISVVVEEPEGDWQHEFFAPSLR